MAKNLEENTINNGTTDTPLKDMINYIFNEFPNAEKDTNNKENQMYNFFDTTVSKNIFATGIFDENLYTIKGSTGQGSWSTIPCISILYNNITDTSKEGEYITYLLSSDRQSIYLCFSKGTDEISNMFPKNSYSKTVNFLRNWAEDVVYKVGSANTRGFDNEIRNMNLGDDDHIKNTDAKYYKYSVAFFKAYTKGNVPEEEELAEDLQCMKNIYQSYITKFRTDNNGNIIDLSFDIYMEDKFPQNNNSTNIGNENQKSNGNELSATFNNDNNLTEKVLGQILENMYEQGKVRNLQTGAIYAFGIIYGQTIIENNLDNKNGRESIIENAPSMSSKTTHSDTLGNAINAYKYLSKNGFISSDSSQTNDKKIISISLAENKMQTEDELATELEELYNRAKRDEGGKIGCVIAFGLRNGKIIEENNYNVKKITEKISKKDSQSLTRGRMAYDYFLRILNNKSEFISIEEGKSNLQITVSNGNDLQTPEQKTSEDDVAGTNVLYYGVPGAGKSYTIDKKIDENIEKINKNTKSDPIEKDSVMERVVFHPDYTYSDFVGQILPKLVPTKDNSEEKKLTYEFVPGPFTRILKKARDDRKHMYYLVIEEINRGNAPAIFGDIFQLLDRNEDGSGEYPITNSDILDYINKGPDENKKSEDENEKSEKVKMPSNLTIYATMNTSDQNVFTLDTAFQRRWDMQLVLNNFDNMKDPLLKPGTETKIKGTNISWRAFATTINDAFLNSATIVSSEDKRLGVHFVNKSELEADKFPQKVLKYLWDDAFRMNRETIFNDKMKSLEDIITKYNSEVDKNDPQNHDPLAAILKDGKDENSIYRKMLDTTNEEDGNIEKGNNSSEKATPNEDNTQGDTVND